MPDMPLVVRDDFSAPFFDGAARGELMLRFSPGSGLWSEPAARLCSATRAADLEWRPASGRGHLVSWTVVPGRSKEGAPPPSTVVGVVETAEGPWLTLRLLGFGAEDGLAAGTRVRVDFVPHDGEGEHLPVGRPDAAGPEVDGPEPTAG